MRPSDVRGHDVYRPTNEADQPLNDGQAPSTRQTSNRSKTAKRRAMKRLRQEEERLAKARVIGLEERDISGRQQDHHTGRDDIPKEVMRSKSNVDTIPETQRSVSARTKSKELPKQEQEFEEFCASHKRQRRGAPVFVLS